ncbi:MAG TPA: DUF99 family protein [Methanoregulaceae archaeon]|nr:DUF99 family protein [Methanoregulaceae archaeon]HOV68533.1 DUF99 family protein [Methanoregulaceae archaeon]HQJ87271.1 DUF99 family protein [Methanoregulaceae archaeon]
MRLEKPGLRVLGIAESYRGRHDEGVRSRLAGIVMRRDLRIDGFAVEEATVGGSDATDSVLRLVRSLGRDDINLVMTSGSVIAWFNVIDGEEVWRRTGVPLVSVTYEPSDGLEEAIARHFPGDEERLERYRSLGERRPVVLSTGSTLFVRPFGLSNKDAARVVDAFTLDGRVPEPVRVARLIARGLGRSTHPGR